MATDEQNVYITGAAGGLADWAKEGTQSAIAQSLKQIQADNNQMLRFLHKIANGEKTSAAHLSKLGAEIKQTRQTAATAADQAGARDTKKASTNRGIVESGRAVLSALVGLRTDTQNETRSAQKREATYKQLINQGFSPSAANSGANAAGAMSKYEKTMSNLAKFSAAILTTSTLTKTAMETGFQDRFAMVSEMRQAGLLASVKKTEQGFVNISNVISQAGFTFGEAADFVQHFSKTVGVTGVKSALQFSKSMAYGSEGNFRGMDLMEKYTMTFSQVSKLSGEYLDSLRISGQLQGRSDAELYSGMGDFMTNVEMTSNILKISLTDAAEAMKNSLKPDDVALLSTLPEEQRKAIQNGFEAMGVLADGNPMAETLAARLSAGGSAQFLQTEEYQQMAGTSVGREVLQFVEKMAQELEGGTSESFSAALADQFPKFADQLTEMASQGGVRVQLLANKQLASMVGSIITAADPVAAADKGMADARLFPEDTAAGEKFIQLREAAVLSEATMNQYMDSFIANMQGMTEAHRLFAERAAEALVFYEPVFAVLQNISTGGGEIATNIMSGIFEAMVWNGSDATLPIADLIESQGGMTQYKDKKGLNQQDNSQFSKDATQFLKGNRGVLKELDAISKNDNLTKELKEAAKERNTTLMKNYQEQINMLAAKIATDEGSRAEDDKWVKQSETLFEVFNALTALTYKLDKNITE